MAGVVFLVMIVIALNRSRREGRDVPRLLGWIGKAGLLTAWLTATGSMGVAAFAALAPVAVPFLAPALVLRRVVVPLGRPRLAYWAARILSPSELVNDSGWGACQGALALAGRRPPPRRSLDWLAGRLDRARFPRGSGIVAAGLLAALRQDRDGARCLFEFADGLDARVLPAGGRAVARDWLVAEAAHKGDWARVTRLGRRGRRSLRWSYCMARIGEHLVAAPGRCPALVLRLCWVAAPRRRATLPLLRRALAVPPAASQDSSAPESLSAAFGALIHLLARRFAHDPARIAEAVNAFDTMLDGPEVLARIERRRLATGAQRGNAAIVADVRTRMAELVAPFIEDMPRLGRADARGAILDRAVGRIRDRWFEDVEAVCKDYRRRADAETALGIVAEWEIWARLRSRADRLLDLDPQSEFVLFQAMYLAVNNFAVFQQNGHKRLLLAFDMYSWLDGRCRHDAAASRLIAKNIKSCRL